MPKGKFKETEIGMIPEDWEVKPLEELSVAIIDGDRGTNYPNGGDFSDSGYCLFLNTKNVPGADFDFTDCMFIKKEKDDVLRKGKLKRKDIVLTTRGTVGNIAFFDENIPFDNIRINSGMVIIRNLEQDFVTEFLFQFLKSPMFKTQVLSSFSGSAQPQLPIRDLKKILLLVPKFNEQQSIAKILSDLDSRIDLNRQMNVTLERIGQALFKHWFVDFEFPNGDGKPYRSSGGVMVDSELGEIPKGWEVKAISEVISVNPQRRLAKGSMAKKVGMADLERWQSWIDAWSIEEYGSGSTFQNEDTLFARITPCLEQGKTAYVSFLGRSEVAFGSTEFIVLAPKIVKSPAYIFFLATSKGLRDEAIMSMSGTSGRQRVPNELFDRYLFPCPEGRVADVFDTLVKRLLIRISENAKAISSLKRVRDILLPRLMLGKIRVSPEVSHVG